MVVLLDFLLEGCLSLENRQFLGIGFERERFSSLLPINCFKLNCCNLFFHNLPMNFPLSFLKSCICFFLFAQLGHLKKDHLMYIEVFSQFDAQIINDIWDNGIEIND